MDLTTTDPGASQLAPHLVVLTAGPHAVLWMNPESGTTCRLEDSGEYAVLRRVADRVVPVVAGQLLAESAAGLVEDPESVLARRAAAQAILAVDRS